MKVSVSLPSDDIEFLDDDASRHGMASRSAAVQRAVELLRASQLGPAYAEAWAAWDAEDGAAWDTTVADGLTRP
jgi:Arc/MetJ-type ribon-helix-helix transcriptional regulator